MYTHHRRLSVNLFRFKIPAGSLTRVAVNIFRISKRCFLTYFSENLFVLNIVPVADCDTPERVEDGKVELCGHVYGLTGVLAQETRELTHLF